MNVAMTKVCVGGGEEVYVVATEVREDGVYVMLCCVTGVWEDEVCAVLCCMAEVLEVMW